MRPSGPKPGRSLGDLYPAQAAEWHATLNGDLTPFDVSPGNNDKAWWKCGRCGSDWPAVINNRTAKYSINCVECNRGRKTRTNQQAGQRPANSVEELEPRLVAEWHPEKNAPLTPSSTPVDWDQNIWWTCRDCLTDWPLPPTFRTSQEDRGCPTCSAGALRSSESTPSEADSLERRDPQVASQWHPTRNKAGVTPRTAAYDSTVDAWWLCQNPACMHEWFTTVKTRTLGNQRGCPVCARPKSAVAAPDHSFAAHYPDVLAEWHPRLNFRLDPYTVKPKASMKVWWLCGSCQHEWPATVLSRTRGKTGCGPCSYAQRGRLIGLPAPGESLADRFPQLAAEWHPTLNRHRPEELKPGSDTKAWWICTEGHVWEANVYSRTGIAQAGCWECAKQPSEGLSLKELYPDLAVQWHPGLNEGRKPEEFSVGSQFQAWWQCPLGHIWQTAIKNRTKELGSGCPGCRTWGTSQEEIRLAHELEAAGCPVLHDHERISVEGRRPVNADIVISEYRVVVEFDGSQYHQGEDAYARDTLQSQALESAGWRVIRVRPRPLNALGPNDVCVESGRDTKAVANSVLKRIRSLGYQPSHIDLYLADQNLWALAKADRDIHARLASNLSSLFADIAAEWHPTLNEDRLPELTRPASRDKAWWKCASCGHDWETAPRKRTQTGSGCLQCARKQGAISTRKPKAENSLAEKKPELLRIFHPTKNGPISLWDLNYGTVIELHWLCPDCGEEWTTRTPRNTGCRSCTAKRVRRR